MKKQILLLLITLLSGTYCFGAASAAGGTANTLGSKMKELEKEFFSRIKSKKYSKAFVLASKG